MPQIFKVGAYCIYFWSNENNPLEPVHVHISKGNPTANATKVWITEAKKCLLCHNNSKIPQTALQNIMRIIEARSDDIIKKWESYFSDIKYYC